MTEEHPFPVWLEDQIYLRGLTKVQVARLLAVSPSTITQWTHGETEPSSQRIATLSVILGVSRYEINLRLERIEPRKGLDPEWDLFIQQVEADGAEFKKIIFNALQDMREAWLVRKRGVRTALRVSVEPYANYLKGMRGTAVWQGDRLLFYDTIVFGDSQSARLMLTAIPDGQWATIQACCYGDIVLQQVMMVLGSRVYLAQIVDEKTAHFEQVDWDDDVGHLLLTIDIETTP